MLRFLYQIPLLRRLYFEKWGWAWIRRKIAPFLPYLKADETIVDVGSGNGLICYYLRQKGFAVTPLDVVSMAYEASVAPVVYDGNVMPFEDKTFDTALVLTVLHHTDTPEAIIAETQRVAKRLIIIEDIYKNALQKYATFAMDSLVNLGYAYTPHTNKDDEGWRTTFEELGLKVVHSSEWRVLFFFRQVVYIVE